MYLFLISKFVYTVLFQDPGTAIPKGTLLAILISSASYLVMAVIIGATVVRDATGDAADLVNDTFKNCLPGECRYGLHNNFQVCCCFTLFLGVNIEI